MMIAGWPCPDAAAPGGSRDELALAFDRGRADRVLIVPALFDEANRLRRFTVETMRGLDSAGIDAILPDLPGTNESLADPARQSLTTWRDAIEAAAGHFRATHVLALRGGALVATHLPGWALGPVTGAALLRQLLRARVLAAREAGREESQENLIAKGLADGLELAGYWLGATLIAELQDAVPAGQLGTIVQSDLGGAGLWLRAEPGESPEQSAALARRIATELGA